MTELTATHCLFFTGLVEIVELLIGAGASLESRDSQGKTALLLAAEAGHVTTMSSLIQHGCQVNVKDNTYSQLTAAHITAQLGKANNMHSLQHVKHVQVAINSAQSGFIS